MRVSVKLMGYALDKMPWVEIRSIDCPNIARLIRIETIDEQTGLVLSEAQIASADPVEIAEEVIEAQEAEIDRLNKANQELKAHVDALLGMGLGKGE